MGKPKTGHTGVELEEALDFFQEARTTKEYCAKFGMGRQVARKDINKLLEEEILQKLLVNPPKYRLLNGE